MKSLSFRRGLSFFNFLALQSVEPQKKALLLYMKYWLFNGDPYDG